MALFVPLLPPPPPPSGSGPWNNTFTPGVIEENNLADTVSIGAHGMVAGEKLRVFGDTLVQGTITGSEVVAGDLHLVSEERNAHWVLREESDRILVINKKTGKRYAMALIDLNEEKDEEK